MRRLVLAGSGVGLASGLDSGSSLAATTGSMAGLAGSDGFVAGSGVLLGLAGVVAGGGPM